MARLAPSGCVSVFAFGLAATLSLLARCAPRCLATWRHSGPRLLAEWHPAPFAQGLSATSRSLRRTGFRRAFRDGSEGRMNNIKDQALPTNLYELLRVRKDADQTEIKKAYYDLQKICHPDVAGEEGEEMCILLNDAYDTLVDPEVREEYNKEVGVEGALVPQDYSTDLSPTWKWSPKRHGHEPVYHGRPRSKSRWEKVKPEDQGQKWQEQQFVFVDEVSCISCRNCCDIAPATFCIDVEHGRARVYSQWGNSEEFLDYATASCPVGCIYWVDREDLQYLEHVMAKSVYETGGQFPCPMALRQTGTGPDPDVFELSASMRQRDYDLRERRQKRLEQGLQAEANKFSERIREVFERLSDVLKRAGWGR